MFLCYKCDQDFQQDQNCFWKPIIVYEGITENKFKKVYQRKGGHFVFKCENCCRLWKEKKRKKNTTRNRKRNQARRERRKKITQKYQQVANVENPIMLVDLVQRLHLRLDTIERNLKKYLGWIIGKLKPSEIKKEVDKLTEKERIEELKKKKEELLDLNQIKWRRELRKHEKEWVNEAKSSKQLEKVEKKLEESTKWNIYDFDGVEHLLGWPVFLVLAGSAFHWVWKESAKEVSSENFLDDIKDKFVKWRLNLWSSVGVYIVLFFLSQQAINKWGYLVAIPLAKSQFLTVLGIAILLGFLYVADNFITSILKTPLQRLGVKIENSPLQEKIKKKLLSKTQEANESFKETFKKFGIVALTPLLISLVGKKIWDANLIANVCFFVPICYAGWRIRQVSKILKRIKKSRVKLDQNL